MAAKPSTAVLIMLKTLCILTFFAAIMFSDDTSTASSRPLTSNHPRYKNEHRHLLAGGGLLLYLMFDDRTVGIDVDASGIVCELYEIAAETFGQRVDRIELRLGDTVLRQRESPLADTGLSFEATVIVTVLQNDIEDLFAMFDHDERTMHTLFSQDQLHWIQEIRAINERAIRSGDHDIRAVVKRINFMSIPFQDMTLEVNHIQSKSPLDQELEARLLHYGLTMIPGTNNVDETARVKVVELYSFKWTQSVHVQWARLPPQTVVFWLTFDSDVWGRVQEPQTFDFRGLQCDNLQELKIDQTPPLLRLDFTGLERCRKLKTLKVIRNAELKTLDLRPLRDLPGLEMLDLSGIMMPAFRWKEILSALAGARSLRTLKIEVGGIDKANNPESWQQFTTELKQLIGRRDLNIE